MMIDRLWPEPEMPIKADVDARAMKLQLSKMTLLGLVGKGT
jgi:hypothetical protein